MPEQRCREKLVRTAESYLKNVAIGLYTFLNRQSLARYRLPLAELIVEKPAEALKLFETAYSRDSALIILRNVFNLLVGDPVKASKAVAELVRGSDEYARRILREACGRR